MAQDGHLRPRGLLSARRVALALVAAAISFGTATAQEWKPNRPVELVATNAPGGGSDRIGRIMIKILQERRLVPTQVNWLVHRPCQTKAS